MERPIVQILIPTFEPEAEYLRHALESVLRQTEQRFSVFIHDDASQIDVAAIVASFLEDSRFAFVRSEKRLGIGGNWNACLSAREAPEGTSYVQFLFQDDAWEPDYLARAVCVLQTHPSVSFVASDHRYHSATDIPSAPQYRALEQLRRETMQTGRIAGSPFLQMWLRRGLHPNLIGEPSFILLRRSLVNTVGRFREDLPQGLDSEYWVRCLAQGDGWWIPGNAGLFRVHGGSASERNRTTGIGLSDRLSVMKTALSILPRPVRAAARTALVDTFAGMLRKGMRRRATGVPVRADNARAACRFILRHPIFTIRALSRAIRERHT